MRSKAIAALAATVMILTGTMASAQSAQSLSLAGAPVARDAGADSELGGRRGWGLLLIPIALGVLIFVVIELGKDNALPATP